MYPLYWSPICPGLGTIIIDATDFEQEDTNCIWEQISAEALGYTDFNLLKAIKVV